MLQKGMVGTGLTVSRGDPQICTACPRKSWPRKIPTNMMFVKCAINKVLSLIYVVATMFS